jgi:uncharacterized protein
MINELGDEESMTLLQNSRFGHLACALNDEPYVVPVNYWCQDHFVYIHTLPGRKLEIMRANPIVCLQVEVITDPYHWRSVIAYGVYEEVNNPAEREQVLAELFKRMPHMTPVESRMSHGLDQTIVFRIRVTRLTGVSEDWH